MAALRASDLSDTDEMSAMPDFMRIVDGVATAALSVSGVRAERIRIGGAAVNLLRVQGKGSGLPVLLLHGLGSRASDLGQLMLGLSRTSREVIAMDLPGHGDSPAPPEGMLPEAIRRVALQAFDRAITSPVVAFGNSLGGLTGLRLGGLRPHLIAGVMVASPAGAPMNEQEMAALLANFAYRSHGEALAFVDRFYSTTGVLRHPFAFGVRQRMGTKAIRDFIGRIGTQDLLDPHDLATLTMPILVFWGKNDRILSPAHAEFFRSSLPPHGVVEVADGYGHAPYIDDPVRFTARIADFVRSCG